MILTEYTASIETLPSYHSLQISPNSKKNSLIKRKKTQKKLKKEHIMEILRLED